MLIGCPLAILTSSPSLRKLWSWFCTSMKAGAQGADAAEQLSFRTEPGKMNCTSPVSCQETDLLPSTFCVSEGKKCALHFQPLSPDFWRSKIKERKRQKCFFCLLRMLTLERCMIKKLKGQCWVCSYFIYLFLQRPNAAFADLPKRLVEGDAVTAAFCLVIKGIPAL